MQPAMVALPLGDLDSPGLKERLPVWVSRGGLREGSGVRYLLDKAVRILPVNYLYKVNYP